jgi:hypothetical protein
LSLGNSLHLSSQAEESAAFVMSQMLQEKASGGVQCALVKIGHWTSSPMQEERTIVEGGEK